MLLLVDRVGALDFLRLHNGSASPVLGFTHLLLKLLLLYLKPHALVGASGSARKGGGGGRGRRNGRSVRRLHRGVGRTRSPRVAVGPSWGKRGCRGWGWDGRRCRNDHRFPARRGGELGLVTTAGAGRYRIVAGSAGRRLTSVRVRPVGDL